MHQKKPTVLLGYIRQCCQQIKGGDLSPPPSTGEATPGAQSPALLYPVEEIYKLTEARPVKGNEDDEGTGASLKWGKTERAGTVCRGHEKAQLYKYLMGRNEEEAARLFSVVATNRTRGNGHKLKIRKFHMNTRKHCFTLKVVKHWDRFPREFV